MILFLALQAVAAQTMLPPVPIAEAAPVRRPSATQRAISLDGMAGPAQPVAIRLQCLVWPNGSVGGCIRAEDGGVQDLATFRTRIRGEAAATDPWLRAAIRRAGHYRLQAVMSDAFRSVLIDEVVAAADVPPPGAGKGLVPQGALAAVPVGASISDYYPAEARLDGLEADMTATCRVMPDYSLWCRDARWLTPSGASATPAEAAVADAFRRATLEALADHRARPTLPSGENSVGHEAQMVIRWRLPE